MAYGKKLPAAFKEHEGKGKGGSKDVAKHAHVSDHKDGMIPHAGHGLHPDHPMLHNDGFHKNEHHG